MKAVVKGPEVQKIVNEALEEARLEGIKEVVVFAEFWGGHRLTENSKWHAQKRKWGL